jgi:DNA-binding XRE family transcriptional regulator
MVDRIKQVMEHFEETPNSFAEKVGVNRSNLTHIFSGRNQPSLDFAKKVLKAFPEVSTEWLIMGVGNMIKDPAEEVPVQRTFIQTDLFGEMDESVEEVTESALEAESMEEQASEPEVESVEATEAEEQQLSPEANEMPEKVEEQPSESEQMSTIGKQDETVVAEKPVQYQEEKLELKAVAQKKRPVVTPSESKIQNKAVQRPEKINSRQVERNVAQGISQSFTMPSGKTQDTPAPREKKIEKIIFFYDDDSFKVFHP